MRKLILPVTGAFFFMCILMGCYGEKIKVNDKSEVYYKDGGTKEEAEKLGAFLLHNNYFDSTTGKSVQLTKSKDTSVVHFVVDEEKLAKTPNAETLFGIMQMLIKDSVFNGKPTKVVLSNDQFRDIKTIKYFGSGDSADSSSDANAADSSAN